MTRFPVALLFAASLSQDGSYLCQRVGAPSLADCEVVEHDDLVAAPGGKEALDEVRDRSRVHSLSLVSNLPFCVQDPLSLATLSLPKMLSLATLYPRLKCFFFFSLSLFRSSECALFLFASPQFKAGTSRFMESLAACMQGAGADRSIDLDLPEAHAPGSPLEMMSVLGLMRQAGDVKGPLSHCSPPDCFIRVSLFGLSLAVQRIVDREREAHAKALGKAAAGDRGADEPAGVAGSVM